MKAVDSGYQTKLIGFVGHQEVSDREALRTLIREELARICQLLGPRVTVLTSVRGDADLVLLLACVDLRIPTIQILPDARRDAADFSVAPEEAPLVRSLLNVALAKYHVRTPESTTGGLPEIFRQLLEFADAFVFVRGEPQDQDDEIGEAIGETRALGIPARIIDPGGLQAHWSFAPDAERGPRHGFESRKELLEFFDSRFDSPQS